MLAKYEVEASRRVPARHADPAPGRAQCETPNGRLTPRQYEVLRLLCEGMPNKLISRNLNIATATVKIHVAAVLRELGVSNRLQAVVAAQRLGLAREWSHTSDRAA